MCLALAIGAPAGAEPCEDLLCVPVLERRLDPIEQWRLTTEQVMAGRGASVLYRDTANRMRAWWVLYEFDRETPWLSEQDAERARDLAQAGSLAGLESLLRATFERSETLGAVYRAGRTVTGADLEITRRRNQTKVRYNARSAGQLAAAEAELDDDVGLRDGNRGSGRQGRGAPTVRTGMQLRLLDVADEPDIVDPALMMTAYLDMRQLGLDAVRLQLADNPPGAKVQDMGSWRANLRQGLVRDLDAFATISGRESRDWQPSWASTGLALRLPTELPWFLRGELGRGFPTTLATGVETPPEWRGMVYLRAQLRWSLPATASGWPLGEEVDPSNRELLPE